MLTGTDCKVIFGGHVAWLCAFGYFRASTLIQPNIKSHYDQDGDKFIGLISSMFLFGISVGGALSGVIMPKFGIRWPTVAAGIFGFFGFIILAYTSTLDNQFWLTPVVGYFLFIGVPTGLALNTTNRAIRDHGTKEHMGLIMIIAIAGNTTGNMILSKIFTKTIEVVNATEITLGSSGPTGNSTIVSDEPATAVPSNQSGYPLLMYIFLEIAVLNASMIIAGFLIPEMIVETENNSELEELNQPEKECLKSQSSTEKTEIEKPDKPKSEKASLISISLLKNRIDYTMFLASHFFFQGGMIIIFTYLAPLLKSIDGILFTNERISNMNQIQGIVEIIGKSVIGLFLIDRYPKIPLLLLGYVGIGIGYGLLWTIKYFKSFMVPAAYAGLAIGGFADAGMGGLLFAILVEIMNGSENYSVAIGMDSLFCNGVSATLAPLFGGFIVDMAKNAGFEQLAYTFVYLLAVGMLATAFMFSVILKIKLKKAKNLNQT